MADEPKWVVEEGWEEINKKGYEASRDHVVSTLRKLADHIESNGSPYLMTYKKEKFLGTITKFEVMLSLPWGG